MKEKREKKRKGDDGQKEIKVNKYKNREEIRKKRRGRNRERAMIDKKK